MSQEAEGYAKQIEKTIRRIPNVLTARVVADPQGDLREIHVLAGSGRAVKYILRDIESSIIAVLGRKIDNRIISIAQLNGDDFPFQEKRVRLTRVEIVSELNSSTVSVYLQWGKTEAVGSSQGAQTKKTWLRAAAQATLNALVQIVPKVSFNLIDVDVNSTKIVPVALVTVVLSYSGEEFILTGSCPVSRDERESIVKATLHAVNRKVATFLDSM